MNFKTISSILILLFIYKPIIAEDRRLALLIGNSDYTNTTTLSNPDNDVEAMAKMLGILGFEVIAATNLSQLDMKIRIDDFGSRLDECDVGLFFYSGHGLQLNGLNYLVPVDVKIESEADIEYNCVNAGRVLAKMENSKTKTNVIIFDACRNNPFKKGWVRDLKNNGLAFMEAPAGSIIAYSTAPGQTASDGDGKYGLYTESLLMKLGDPKLNIIQVFQEVRKLVKEKSDGKQIPWESTSLENDFYFNQSLDEVTFAKTSIISDSEKDLLSNRSIKESIKNIKDKEKYYWAEGKSVSIEEADKLAKSLILQKIKMKYKSQITDKHTGYNENNSEIIDKALTIYIEELNHLTARRVYRSGKSYTSFRYIPESEIDKHFYLKRSIIISMYDSGLDSERKNEIGEAIKYYFWVYALSSGCPEQNKLEFDLPQETQEENRTYQLGLKINNLISSIQVLIVDSIIHKGYKRYKIQFESNNDIVPYIGYKYWNGNSWSKLNTTNNGIGFIDLYNDTPGNDLKIKIEYRNIESSAYDRFLEKLVTLSVIPGLDDIVTVKPISYNKDQFNVTPFASDTYTLTIQKLIDRVNSRNETFNPDLFTEEGFEVFKSLLLYGNASFFESSNEYQAIITKDYNYIRGIPTRFRFPNSNTEFIENLCIELDKKKRINNISFSLDHRVVADVLAKERWPEESKWIIINFLENYKTAYALKRSDYIEKIFSDKALIIVGQRVEVSEESDGYRYSLTGENYEFTKLTKQEYLYRLRNVFSKNEFINIRFEENIVKKRDNHSDVYGINIKQNYFSSNYADQGYLFLMVDMKEPKEPMIYVRSWQPQKLNNNHIINLSDFTY